MPNEAINRKENRRFVISANLFDTNNPGKKRLICGPEVRNLCAKERGEVCTQARKPLTRTFLGITSVWEASYEVSSVTTFNNHDPGAAYP